jgi:uncharacterized membrane protein YfhO
MYQAHVPAGKHVIELRYWPTRFTQGSVIAASAVLGFVVVGLDVRRRHGNARVRKEPLR